MYKQRMESAKVQFRYELRLSHEKATVREEKASEKISGMEKELTMIKAYAEDKKKEAAYFQKEEEQLRNALKKKQDHAQEEDRIFMLDEIFQLINNTISSHTDYLRRIATEPSYSAIQARHIALMKDMIREYLGTEKNASKIRKISLGLW